MFGRKQVHIVTTAPIKDRVFWKGDITVLHLVVFLVGGKCEPLVVALDVMLP